MVIIDFETTGLLTDSSDPMMQPGIVQIGAAQLNGEFEVVAEYKQLVNPEKPASLWEEGAIKTHGIKPEMVLSAPTFPAVFHDLSNFVGKWDGVWGGYNNMFDRKVLWWQLLRYGLEMRFPWPSRDIDIMKVGTDVCNMPGKQGIKPPKLVELHKFLFNEDFAGAHDALQDVLATARCAKELNSRGYL
jgi:DNA polymerase-3 subunit epsilon